MSKLAYIQKNYWKDEENVCKFRRKSTENCIGIQDNQHVRINFHQVSKIKKLRVQNLWRLDEI